MRALHLCSDCGGVRPSGVKCEEKISDNHLYTNTMYQLSYFSGDSATST